MPKRRRLTMRQLRQLLRLSADGMSVRDIATMLGIARSTVQDNIERATAAGLSWPVPAELTDDALEHRLFSRQGVKQGLRRRPEPDWRALAVELKKPGVTLSILWEEYRAVHPEGYAYSRFCDLFRGFERRLTPTMRQVHVAGDKVFVDYSGKKLPIADRKTGEIREAEIFLGVLGASSYTYAEATWSQTLPDWIGSHVRMFRFFGGVPRLIVPDNLKSGVNRPGFYDPEINRSFGMMASHYGVGVLPARPKRPKDKAKVESGVRFAQTCILGRLRRQTFFSLAEANAAIREALDRINDPCHAPTGRSAVATCSKPWNVRARRAAGRGIRVRRMASGPRLDRLPCRVQELFLLRAARPHPPAGRHSRDKQDDRDLLTGKRIAVHQRRYGGGVSEPTRTTCPVPIADMPNGRRSAFDDGLRSIGPQTEGLVIAILANRPHPEQGFRTCLGVLRLYRDSIRRGRSGVGPCCRDRRTELQKHQRPYHNPQVARHAAEPGAVREHANLRGPGYFH